MPRPCIDNHVIGAVPNRDDALDNPCAGVEDSHAVVGKAGHVHVPAWGVDRHGDGDLPHADGTDEAPAPPIEHAHGARAKVGDEHVSAPLVDRKGGGATSNAYGAHERSRPRVDDAHAAPVEVGDKGARPGPVHGDGVRACAVGRTLVASLAATIANPVWPSMATAMGCRPTGVVWRRRPEAAQAGGPRLAATALHARTRRAQPLRHRWRRRPTPPGAL